MDAGITNKHGIIQTTLEGESNPEITSTTLGDVGGNSAQAGIEEVRVGVISAPIELNQTIYFNFLVFVILSCYSRRLKLQESRVLGVWRKE
jgi:hypothetical protein